MYDGSERFLVKREELELTMSDFWIWAYSDLSNNIQRSVFAEFVVASALGITNMESERSRIMWRPYDLLTKQGYRVEVKSAAYIQSWDAKHPDHITFRIAPARIPDETGDYKLDAPLQRNSDLYVFCVYTAMTVDESPLDMDLWDFYVLPTHVLNREKATQKTITFPSLLKLNPVKSDFASLESVVSSLDLSTGGAL